MNYKKILQKLLLEKGAKKADGLESYYFLKPESVIVDKNGWEYTVSKVVLEPEIEIHCYRYDVSPDNNVIIIITADEFNKYYRMS